MKSAEKAQGFRVASSTALAKNPGSIINNARYRKEITVITNQGAPAAAVVPLEVIESIVLSDADREILLSVLNDQSGPSATLTSAMQEFKSRHPG
jgi:hypothetical protein